ncbi:MAG: GTPase [Candidatus Daviesbacteria bacterium]|nr:GTPase [Candidatus Daviesbacteria bacterium]
MNQDIEFMKLQKQLKKVGSMSEKIELLEQITSLNPRDSKRLSIRSKYKQELGSLRKKSSIKNKTVFNGYDITSKYQVVLLGQTNTGKSTLHSLLTGSNVEISDTPFTTYKPEVGIMDCKDISVQLVEVPAIYKDEFYPAKYRLIRNADMLCICSRTPDDFKQTVGQLEDKLLILCASYIDPSSHKNKPLDNIIEKPGFSAVWEVSLYEMNIPALNISDKYSITEHIFSLLNVKRIYSFRNDQIGEKPFVFPLDQRTSVFDYITRLDKRLLVHHNKAKIFGSSAKYEGQIVGFDHLLLDGDKVELIK